MFLISPTTAFLITPSRPYLVPKQLLIFCCRSHCLETWETNCFKPTVHAVYKRMSLLKAPSKFNILNSVLKGFINRNCAEVESYEI
jgi:hypothetical protein